jgi:hypothetical protein
VPRVPSPHAGVTPTGETQLPSPQRTSLLLPRSYGLIRQSQRPLLYFGLPSLKESSQVVTSPCCPLDLPDVISENLSLDAGSHTPAVPPRALACFFRGVLGLPHKELGRLPANCPLETTSCGPLISGRQIFLYVPASQFVLPPRSSLPLRVLPQGSRGFDVRAERASLPPHAPDMLTVRIQAIGGTRTFTSLDPRLCRPLPPCPTATPGLARKR